LGVHGDLLGLLCPDRFDILESAAALAQIIHAVALSRHASPAIVGAGRPAAPVCYIGKLKRLNEQQGTHENHRKGIGEFGNHVA
jgi:hypothetical protein